MFTFGDHVAELQDRFPRIPPAEADAITWQAIKDVFNDGTWDFAVKTGYLVTEASYNTGTVALTAGSTAVTLTGGTWDTAWTTLPSSRRFLASGRSEPYGLTVTGTTTGTLDLAWQGETDADAEYSIYRDRYSLPFDCDHKRLWFIVDPTRGRLVQIRDYGVLIRAQACTNTFAAPGTPEFVALAGLTSTGIPQVIFGPQAPSTAETFIVHYFAKPTRPTGRSSLIAPAVPESYEDLIWRRAVWQASVHPRYRRPENQQYEMEYYDRLFEAQSRFNGESEITRRLTSRDVAGSDPDSAWNPRVEYVP